MNQRAGGLEDLFRDLFEPLVGALAVAAGSREAAADAVQDAFVQAHRHWATVSGYDNPSAWVRRVAVNRIVDQHRSRARFERAAPKMVAEFTAAPDLADRLAVVQALGQLDDRDRMVVCLYYLADLAVADVAAACALSPASVKTILHRARRNLGRSLGDLR